jgi:hypothetical protein
MECAERQGSDAGRGSARAGPTENGALLREKERSHGRAREDAPEPHPRAQHGEDTVRQLVPDSRQAWAHTGNRRRGGVPSWAGAGAGAEQFWRRAAATAVLHQPEVDECVQAGEVDAGSGACACACRRRRLLCCVCVCVLCVCVCASLARPGPGGAHCEPTPLPPTALACRRSLMATAHPPEPLSCL